MCANAANVAHSLDIIAVIAVIAVIIDHFDTSIASSVISNNMIGVVALTRRHICG